jgi:hypothetical protein
MRYRSGARVVEIVLRGRRVDQIWGRKPTSGFSASMSVHASQADKTSRVTDGTQYRGGG